MAHGGDGQKREVHLKYCQRMRVRSRRRLELVRKRLLWQGDGESAPFTQVT